MQLHPHKEIHFMPEKKKAVLLVNVGTPDRPDTTAVRRYLTHFLNDKRIMDIPWLFRKILVNLIIVPFRAPRSARLYRRLWTPQGSPLVLNMEKFATGLQKDLGISFHVYTAMRYGNPSLAKTLEDIRIQGFDEIIVFPLFPQYASSTTGTIFDFVLSQIKRWHVIPELRFVNQFYDHPGYLDAFASKIAACHPETFDHVVFSYHGLPNRHIERVHPGISAAGCSCETALPKHGKHCYKATCYETSRMLAQKLHLDKSHYTVSFQSRFSKNWLQPFTDQVIRELAEKGVRKVLVAVPSFVADCLESLIEIRMENGDLFRQYGGEQLILVDSLNNDKKWIEAAADIIRSAGVTI